MGKCREHNNELKKTDAKDILYNPAYIKCKIRENRSLLLEAERRDAPWRVEQWLKGSWSRAAGLRGMGWCLVW